MMRQDGTQGGRAASPRVGRWCPQPDGAVSAEAGALRLVVHPPGSGGYARFLVLRRTAGAGGDAAGRALLASGSEEDVPAAMRAAERVAARIVAS